MLTEKDYCDYDTCVALKELGYKGISRFFYATKKSPLRRYSHDQILTSRIADAVGHTLAISLYVAQKWLREEKHIDVLVYLDDLKGYFSFIRIWEGSWKTFVNLEERDMGKVTYFANYEEALSEGVKEAVKILKEK